MLSSCLVTCEARVRVQRNVECAEGERIKSAGSLLNGGDTSEREDVTQLLLFRKLCLQNTCERIVVIIVDTFIEYP